jgi:hypothetical protein
MSAYVYGANTRNRERAGKNKSDLTDPPGLSPFVDSLVALVPVEVLVIHAGATAFFSPTKLDNPEVKWGLTITFAACIALSIFLYARGHKGGILTSGESLEGQVWDSKDLGRMLIPAVAFVAWTMAQRETAWDAVVAVAPILDSSQHTRAAVAAVLGVASVYLAARSSYKQDNINARGYEVVRSQQAGGSQ